MYPQFAQIIMTVDIPENFTKFLVAQGIISAENLGNSCSTELEVKEEIIKPALAANVKLENLIAKSKVVNL